MWNILVLIWKFPLEKKSHLHLFCLENPSDNPRNVVLSCCGEIFVFKARYGLGEMFEKYIAQCVDGLFIVCPAALYPVITRLP